MPTRWSVNEKITLCQNPHIDRDFANYEHANRTLDLNQNPKVDGTSLFICGDHDWKVVDLKNVFWSRGFGYVRDLNEWISDARNQGPDLQ